MKAIGISPLDKDSTVSAVEDGRILYAAGEERFSRQKQQDGFPAMSIKQALDVTGWDPNEVDVVSYPFLDWKKEVSLFNTNIAEESKFIKNYRGDDIGSLVANASLLTRPGYQSIHGLQNPSEKVDKGFLHKGFYRVAGGSRLIAALAAQRGSKKWASAAHNAFKKWQNELDQGLAELGWAGKLKRIDHHLSHASNAYLTSGMAKALIVTLDGYGSGLAGSISIGDNGQIRRLHGVQFPHSLGTMYEHVTSSLGYKPGRHEGKIVGLASYGDVEVLGDILLNRIVQSDGDYKIYGANNVYFSRYLAARFPKIDVAAAYQYVLEKVAASFVSYWVSKTGITSVVLSGGVTANVKLNQRIFEIPEVERIFVYPNMGDGGCGTGAALYHTRDPSQSEPLQSTYLGPEFSEVEIRQSLDSFSLDYSKPKSLAEEVAKLIHDGNVVARFDGRMEYGPRALGNRSIMYHAKEPEVNQWLNKRLGRTEFMPFAPVTLYEARERCYLNIEGAEHAAEFMTITFDCSEEMKKMSPAAVHVDGTARPQLIRREVNPGYYDILKAYERLSGIPSLINTSFNMHEEPIVCTPNDAIRAFLDGNLDFLVIGPYLVKGRPNQA